MALYLHCALCSRKQAHGLLSSHAWGKHPLPDGVSIEHPAIHDGHVRTCPSCCGQHRNWPVLAFAALGVTAVAL